MRHSELKKDEENFEADRNVVAEPEQMTGRDYIHSN